MEVEVALHDAPDSDSMSISGSDVESFLPTHSRFGTTKANMKKQSIFELVTSELMKIGAIPLERFETEDNPEEESTVPATAAPTKLILGFPETKDSSGALLESSEGFQAISKIYEACTKTFGNSDAIHFEYLEGLGPKSRECILTVTRPDGRKRSYTSGPFYSKKIDAKARAAALGVSMNLIDFIKFGDIDPKSRATAVVVPLEPVNRLKVEDGKGVSIADNNETVVDDENVKAIADCCIEWRAGTVKPVYMHFSEPTIIPRDKGKKAKQILPTDEEIHMLKQGCVLKIAISEHATRVYSVHHTFRNRAEAKKAVAFVALKQGVIDFIKYANGQTSPLVLIRELDGDADENLNREVIEQTREAEKEVTIEATSVNVKLKKHQIPLDAMTLQAFTNSLTKPFPETPGLKPLGDGNPIGWVNTAVQSARGSKMSITWTYLSNAKLSLHGCLVRFNLPKMENSRTYLVEPQFTKRADAKSAVALYAISQNVGGWIYEISKAIEDLLTPDMKVKAANLIAPLNSECTRAGLQGQPLYIYEHEEGAVGCTIRVEFAPNLSHSYVVPTQYRTKTEARAAVILQAYHDGILEFIRFKGASPPPGYNREVPFDWKMTKKIEGARDHGLSSTSDVLRGGSFSGKRKLNDRGGFGSSSQKSRIDFRNTGSTGMQPPTPFAGERNASRFVVPRPDLDHPIDAMRNSNPRAWNHAGESIDFPNDVDMGGLPYGEDDAQVSEPISGPSRHHSQGPFHYHPNPQDPYVYGNMPPPFAAPIMPAAFNPYFAPMPPSIPPPPHYMHQQPGVYHPYAEGPPSYPHPNSFHPSFNDGHYNGSVRPPYGQESYFSEVTVSESRQFIGDMDLVPYGMPSMRSPTKPSVEPPKGPRALMARLAALNHASRTENDRGRNLAGRSAESPTNTRLNQSTDEVSPITNSIPKPVTPTNNDFPVFSNTPVSRPEASKKRKHNANPDAQSGKFVGALLAHCSDTAQEPPVFRQKEIKPGEFKVWVEMNKTRFELPSSFPTVAEGKERVARQVLARLRSLNKKQKREEEKKGEKRELEEGEIECD